MVFKGLKKGLKEALAHAEGKITLKSEIIEVPVKKKPKSKVKKKRRGARDGE